MSAKVVTKKGMDDPELQEMFNQMIGASDPDPMIIKPKYESILADAGSIIKVIENVFVVRDQIPQALLEDFGSAFDEVAKFVADSRSELAELTLIKIAETDVMGIPSYGYGPKLGETYKAIKESKLIERLLVATRDLKTALAEAHSKLDDKDNMSADFITKVPGDSFVMMSSICSMDFKQMLLHPNCTAVFKHRVLFWLYILNRKGANITKVIMSPDLDVDKFSEILVENIGKLKKSIPRCDKAFDKIRKSVDMLKGNFGEYYKDFVVSRNPGIIVENFVTDVAGSSKADAETTRQFAKIIAFYKEKMSTQKRNPQLDKLFDLLGSNMKELERKTGKE